MCPRCGEKIKICKTRFRDTKYFLFVCDVCENEWIEEDTVPKMPIDTNNCGENNLLR